MLLRTHTVVPTTAAPYSTPLITATTAALILHHTAHHSSHRPQSAAPNTTEPTAAAPNTVAPTTAALAMLHHTLCVAPSEHILLLTFLLFPQIIHSLAFLFFAPIVIIAHAVSPCKNFMPTIVLCKYVLAIAFVRIVCYLNRCVAKVNR